MSCLDHEVRRSNPQKEEKNVKLHCKTIDYPQLCNQYLRQPVQLTLTDGQVLQGTIESIQSDGIIFQTNQSAGTNASVSIFPFFPLARFFIPFLAIAALAPLFFWW
jgi:hypothetical protein